MIDSIFNSKLCTVTEFVQMPAWTVDLPVEHTYEDSPRRLLGTNLYYTGAFL